MMQGSDTIGRGLHRSLGEMAVKATLWLALWGTVWAMILAIPGLLFGTLPAHGAGIGTRVFVVQRETGSLAVYDYQLRKMIPSNITGLGNLRHATMIFTPDLRYGFLSSRSGNISRIDLATLKPSGEVKASDNSIDNAVSHDGRYIATAEYQPGGVTIIDAESLKIVKNLRADVRHKGLDITSRVTGMVDAPGGLFVCVLIEGAQIWIIDANDPTFPVIHRIPTVDDSPYDAMITPDGRWYVVAHLNSPRISLLDLQHPERGARTLDLRDSAFERGGTVKLPHMASWAVAGERVFLPMVGEKRLVVLNRHTWKPEGSVPLRGKPVYAVRSPTEREIWVSFAGEEDHAYIQVVDTKTLKVTHTLRAGERIYHMDFTPRGSHVLVSANLENRLVLINAHTYKIEDTQTVKSPSGIFGVWRAFRIGL